MWWNRLDWRNDLCRWNSVHGIERILLAMSPRNIVVSGTTANDSTNDSASYHHDSTTNLSTSNNISHTNDNHPTCFRLPNKLSSSYRRKG